MGIGLNPSVPVTQLFAPHSIWNDRLPVDAPLDPSSPARMDALASEIRSEEDRNIGPWITEHANATPFYVVGPDQPRVNMQLDPAAWKAPLQHVLDEGVPIPDGAVPSTGSDAYLTIYQPSTDTLWEFWRAVHDPDGWHASWGGAMQHVSASPGYYTDQAWSGLASGQGFNWGATATSLPVIGGTIMMNELWQGHIDHALAMNVPDACSNVFSWPAQRSDGSDTAPDCVPEGAHLRLDPDLDLSTLDLPPITRALAEAAQQYGLVVRDVTHHAVSFFAENWVTVGSNVYRAPGGLYGGLMPWAFMPRFPWDHLQLLQMHLCTKAPCV